MKKVWADLPTGLRIRVKTVYCTVFFNYEKFIVKIFKSSCILFNLQHFNFTANTYKNMSLDKKYLQVRTLLRFVSNCYEGAMFVMITVRVRSGTEC